LRYLKICWGKNKLPTKLNKMKKLLIIALAAVTFNAKAQPVYVDRIGFKLESIADIDIGWMEICKHNTAPKGKQLGNRKYSAKQIGNCQQFIEWMQQSYTPRGCLGNATYHQNYIPTFSGTNSLLGNAINTHAHALPLMYGAQTKIHMFLKKDAKGKFVPQTSHGDFWFIEANQLRQISKPISFISSTEAYYFLLPNFRDNKNGYNDADRARSDLLGFDKHKNIAKYQHFFLPSSQYVVIMTKDNKALPFEKITIGEFFTEAEKKFPVWQKIVPVSAENYVIAQKNIARLKEKYKPKWNDYAELRVDGPDISLQYFVNATEGYDDIFDKKETQATFAILKVKQSALELCKTDPPQWLVIRWTWGMENQAYFLHFHESILNNFNFDYAYNYFFEPEKIKGQAYKPQRSPSFKEAVVVSGASEASKKISTDKSIFFFEDFSTTSIGKKPIGWEAKFANGGTTAVVSKPDGLDGNWVALRGHKINASSLKKPLPQNFTLSYDLVATQNFTWGAKGLSMLLSKETSAGNAESFIKVKLRPGFDGRDGEAELETKFTTPPGYLTGSKWYTAKGFSNNNKNNRISITIKKTGEMLQVFINKTKIAEYEKALPDAHLFNALSFDCAGNSAENDTYYISNIKITKD